MLGTIEFEEFYAWFSNHLTGTATPRHMMLADVRRKMRHYTPSNIVIDTLGPALGLVVPTDWSLSRMVGESQSVWAKLTSGTALESSKKKRVRDVFNKYDTDGSGALDLEEFGHFCADLGDNFTPEQLEVALHEIDEDGNGTIEFEEFYQWWCADPTHEGDADFANRLRNMVFGYRDKKPMDQAKDSRKKKLQKAGATGDPALIAENRRLKQELADLKAQISSMQGGASNDEEEPTKGGVSFKKTVSERDVAPPPRKGKSSQPETPEEENDSEPEEEAKPAEQPRKKKGKRKSRKPQKLEDSDDYETSEDQTAKAVKNKAS